MTYKELLSQGEQILKESNVPDYSYDAFALLEFVFSINRASYYIRSNDIIEREEDIQKYMEMIAKRSNRIPLQHITDSQEFMGLPFYVNKNVLCPRQDTECLVEETMKVISEKEYGNSFIQVIDMCTGSGCIAISLMKLVNKKIFVTAVDLSLDALEVAKKNAENNRVIIEFVHSDLFENVENILYDVIVSNPPYIRTKDIDELMDEVRLHEPLMALDGHKDGLYFYKEITKKSKKYLCNGGYILFEIGYDQAEAVKAILEKNGFDDIEVIKDLAGLDRVVKGRKIGGRQSVR